MMKRTSLSIFAALASLTCIPYAQAQSLNQLLETSVFNHPSVLKAVDAAKAAGFEVDVAKSGSAPKISTFIENGRTLAGRAGTSSTAVSNYGLRGVYYLYDGGRVKSDTARAESKRQTFLAGIEQAQLEVAQRTTELYLESSKQNALLDVAKDSFKAHSEIYQKMLEIAKLDPGRKFDVEQALVRLNNSQLNVYNRQQARDDALNLLARYLSMPATRQIEFQTLPIIESLPNNLYHAQKIAFDHPKVKQAITEVTTAKALASLASAQAKPKVGIELTAGSPKAAGQNREWLSTLDAKFLINYDAYDGGSSDAAIAGALAQVRTAESAQALTTQEVNNEISRLWQELQTRDARLPQLSQLVAQNKLVTTGLFELFKVGRRTILDLLNAENDRLLAHSNFATEVQDTLATAYKIKIATGLFPYTITPAETVAP